MTLFENSKRGSIWTLKRFKYKKSDKPWHDKIIAFHDPHFYVKLPENEVPEEGREYFTVKTDEILVRLGEATYCKGCYFERVLWTNEYGNSRSVWLFRGDCSKLKRLK